MPRIYVTHRDWDEPVDYCRACFPRSEQSAERHWSANVAWDAEHPPYDDDVYTCQACGRTLTNHDN